ncbi:MAG: ATP-binding protein [Phycisphaeraceae bacterium]|nr:ATP-binding protein [Phycisphaeraceae bacterium]
MQPSPGPDHESLRATVTADRSAVAGLVSRIMDIVERFNYPKTSRFAIHLALEEAVSNAFRHGHKLLPPDAAVTVEAHVDARRVRIAVEDQGPGFTPDTIPDPTLDENLAKPDGRGLMLIRAYMTRVDFNPRGNRLEMTYERPPSP